jgi:glutamyl/glutaminyl-tRNA synthetase
VSAGLIPAHPDPAVSGWLTRVIDAVKTHVDHFDQLPKAADIDTIYAFQTTPPQLEEEARQILGTPEARSVAVEFLRLVAEREILTLDAYKEILGQVKTATKQKGKNLFHPIRAALTGRGSGPELEKLIPIYEEGSRLSLPRPVMSCRQRLETVLQSL